MSEDRYAHLTAGLLARKGDAEPALEPFAHARVAESARRMTPGSVHKLERSQSDLRHPDHHHTSHHARQPDVAPHAPAPPPRAPARSEVAMSRQEFLKRRAAVTFRMPTHDFLRLKLASAELDVSCQNIVLAALEAFLDANGVERLDECNCLREAARLTGAAQAAKR